MIVEEDVKMCEKKTEKHRKFSVKMFILIQLCLLTFSTNLKKYFSCHIVVIEFSNRIISRPKAKKLWKQSDERKKSKWRWKKLSSHHRRRWRTISTFSYTDAVEKIKLRNAVVNWRMSRLDDNIIIIILPSLYSCLHRYRNNAKCRSAIEPKINSRCERGPGK